MKTINPIYKQVVLIFLIVTVAVATVLWSYEQIQVEKRFEEFTHHLYGISSTILSRMANVYLNQFASMDEPRKLLDISNIPMREVNVYHWANGKWNLIFKKDSEIFSTSYLTSQFKPVFYPDVFTRFGEIFVYKNNDKLLKSETMPAIICGYELNGEKFLLTAAVSPAMIDLILDNDPATKRRILVESLIISLLASILLTFLLNRDLNHEIPKLTKFLSNENEQPKEIWQNFTPLVEQIEKLHRKIQEMQFEFEREAAIITAKSETRLRSLALLRDITSIGNSVTDTTLMMKQFLEKLNRFFHTLGASAFIIAPDGKVEFYYTDSLPEEYVKEIQEKITKSPDELMKRKVEKGGFIFLEEVKFITEDTKLAEIAAKHGIIGYIRIPLYRGNEYIGGIHLYSLRVFPNDDAFEKLIKAVGEEISVAIENRRLYADLERRLKESLALYEISKALISAVDYDLLLEQILWIVQESFDYAATSILLLDEEKNELYVKVAWGFQTDVYQHRIPVGKGITGWVASTGQPLIVPDVTKDSRFIPTDLDVRSEMAVPLVVGGKVIGVLDVESREVNRFTEQDLWFLSSLAAQASLAIDRAKLYQQLKEQAIKDALTGLYNRRFCEDYIQQEARENLLKGFPVSIIMIDINGLKRVNDTYGHSAGDTLLVEIANFLKSKFPDTPIARYGGDEFIVFLNKVPRDKLDEIVSELRRAKVQWQIKMSEKYPFPMDFAIGAATATRPDELEMIIDYADNLMYRDKHGLM